MPHQPSVSVLMSVYNSCEHVRDAIRSILDQTLADFEFVIINDGSTDSTLSVIAEFEDPRIVIQNITHRGLAGALNAGLKLTRGEFVARMDADDIALSNRLQKQLQFMRLNPDIAVLGTAYEIVLADGSKKPATIPPLKSDTEIKRALPKFNPLMHSSVMIRKSALADHVYDESFEMAQDYDLWLRLSKKYKFENLNEKLMLRRESGGTLEKEKVQNWYAIKARLNAVTNGYSNLLNLIYLFRPLLVILTPIWLKQLVRLMIRKSHE